jgi:hypothetical protein
MILKEGFELMIDCRFFSHELTLTRRNVAGYGIFAIVEKRPMGFSCCHDMPMAGHTLEAPPPYHLIESYKT